MASIMIHLETAWRLMQSGGLFYGKINDPGEYYLGIIAPDSVNLDGFAEKEIRWAAHLRAKTPKQWYQNIGEFYQKKREKLNHDFLLGYAVHNITDAAFDETLHEPIWAAAKKADTARIYENPNDAGWAECFRYDYFQQNQCWWVQDVSPALKSAQAYKINKLPADLIDRYRLYLMDSYFCTLEREAPKVITKEIVWLLADYVESQCCKILSV